MYEGDYVEDLRHGYGVLKEIRDPTDVEGERYIEYLGHWENDVFHGKGRLLIYDSRRKQIKFEEHDGGFRDGYRDGLGKQIRLKDSDMYGDDEEFRREIFIAQTLEYTEFIGDFYNDRPVYHSGVLKTVKVPVVQPESVALTGLKYLGFRGASQRTLK